MEKINQSKYACLTADGWTNKSRSYMGTTVHFFDEQLNKQSFLLAFRRMYGRHTHDAIKDILVSIMKDFKVKVSKVTHIVTDGASNFEKAFKVYGSKDSGSEPQNEQWDDDDTTECANIEEMFEPDSDHMIVPDGTESVEIELNRPMTFDDVDDDDYDETESSRLPDQLKCYAHSLNRSGVDFDKAIEKEMKRGYEMLNTAYNKLNKFWNLSSRSTVAHEIVERICKRHFPHPIDTRWNYKTDSIGIAEQHKLKINEAIEEINKEATKNAPKGNKKKKLEKLTVLEWKILKDYVTCMRPVSMGLDILQGDKRSSQGYILPVLYGIKAGLEDNLANNSYVSDYGEDFNSILLNCIESRFGEKMQINEDNKDLILSAAIHPKFKLSWLLNESEREFVQTMLINTCVELASSSSSNQNENSDQTESRQNAKSNENIFFKHLQKNQQTRRSSSDDSVTLEVYKYILEPPADPSPHVFRDHPVLEDIFRHYNTTLSSSASVERIFSQALIVFTPRRNKISDETFEKALFVNRNRKLLNVNVD